jgi:hypothetical protein
MINLISLLQSISSVLNRRDDSTPASINSVATSIYSTILFPQGPTPITTSLTVYGTNSISTLTYTSPVSTVEVTTIFEQTLVSFPVEPLTTIFTPHTGCLSVLFAENHDSDSAMAANPTFHLPQTERLDCFPKDYFLVTYYSPGICPSGYTVDYFDITETVISGSTASESRGICCPS